MNPHIIKWCCLNVKPNKKNHRSYLASHVNIILMINGAALCEVGAFWLARAGNELCKAATPENICLFKSGRCTTDKLIIWLDCFNTTADARSVDVHTEFIAHFDFLFFFCGTPCNNGKTLCSSVGCSFFNLAEKCFRGPQTKWHVSFTSHLLHKQNDWHDDSQGMYDF